MKLILIFNHNNCFYININKLQASSLYMNRRIQHILWKLASGYVPPLPPQQLSMENISAALLILAFGCLAGFLVLIVEIFYHRFQQKLRSRIRFEQNQKINKRKENQTNKAY